MELKRKPLQGVLNIIRFNWHLFLIPALVVFMLLLVANYLSKEYQLLALSLAAIVIMSILISLITSTYIYDFSNLYLLNWLPNTSNKNTLNINAGFDETSQLIKRKFPETNLKICDFYNPLKHTEVSIKRARKAYPPHKDTIPVSSVNLPYISNEFSFSIATFSAHEIRDENERITFFKELNRITKPQGRIIITEHLRDFNNMMVYTIGSLHFYSKHKWMTIFSKANLVVIKELKTTPFITTFILQNNGNTD